MSFRPNPTTRSAALTIAKELDVPDAEFMEEPELLREIGRRDPFFADALGRHATVLRQIDDIDRIVDAHGIDLSRCPTLHPIRQDLVRKRTALRASIRERLQQQRDPEGAGGA